MISNSKQNIVNPVFIFGLSGATWTVIKPLVENGRLPNMQRLMEQGCSGMMQSIKTEGDKHYRPQTAWPSLATSLVPNRHGITKFWHTSDDLKVEPIWDIFQRKGHRVGLYGWPMTWPPGKIDGFIIPCHHARDSQTCPQEFSPIKELDQCQKRMEREKGLVNKVIDGAKSIVILAKFGLRMTTLQSLANLIVKYLISSDAEERTLYLRYAKLELSVDFFLNLYKHGNFAFANFTSFLVDLVSHRYWRYYEPEKFEETDQKAISLYGGALEEAYEKFDAALGRCLEAMPSNIIVAVVSEHGMSAETESTEVGSYRYVIRGSRLLSLVGLGEEYIPCPVARWIAIRHRAGSTLAPGLEERIKRITVVETDLPLFNVYRHGNKEVIVKFNIDHKVPRYKDGHLENLTLSYNGKEVPFLEITWRLGRQRSAMHDDKAVFVISGTGIRNGVWLQNLNLLDFAPTILRASGLDIPSTYQGKVLDIFE